MPENKPEARARYALHEAFLAGDTIGVNCVLPDGLSMDDLWQLMDVAGTYKGISSFKPDEGYGTFRVEEVRPRRRSIDPTPPRRSPVESTQNT